MYCLPVYFIYVEVLTHPLVVMLRISVSNPRKVARSLTESLYPKARTFPASGTFTSAQKDLYTAVLTAQKELIKLCTETTGLTLARLHDRSCELLRRGLAQLGFDLSRGDLERILYPHSLSAYHIAPSLRDRATLVPYHSRSPNLLCTQKPFSAARTR